MTFAHVPENIQTGILLMDDADTLVRSIRTTAVPDFVQLYSKWHYQQVLRTALVQMFPFSDKMN